MPSQCAIYSRLKSSDDTDWTPIRPKKRFTVSDSAFPLNLLLAAVVAALVLYCKMRVTSYLGALASGLTAIRSVSAQGCPSYTDYSQVPHGDNSTGPLGLPYMRPDPTCRTFNSSAVEVSHTHTIKRMGLRGLLGCH